VTCVKPKRERARRIERPPEGEAIEFKVGNRFYYQFRRHGSVGIDGEFDIEDTTVIQHEDTRFKYTHPENLKPGWTGGDDERGKWLFRALKAGETKITIRKMFRGRIDEQFSIRLVVKT